MKIPWATIREYNGICVTLTNNPLVAQAWKVSSRPLYYMFFLAALCHPESLYCQSIGQRIYQDWHERHLKCERFYTTGAGELDVPTMARLENECLFQEVDKEAKAFFPESQYLEFMSTLNNFSEAAFEFYLTISTGNVGYNRDRDSHPPTNISTLYLDILYKLILLTHETKEP
ncbi:MAG: hypothetical protein HQL56_08845 [Magnetococcales bacterium]|nr:hypothetical protein [Magnetococcales bacterium]